MFAEIFTVRVTRYTVPVHRQAGMQIRRYLLSLPERVVRALVGVGAGVTREVGDVAVPQTLRQTQLYQNLVDTTLRFLIEQVGDVQGVYEPGTALADDFLVRRSAGNAIEMLGIVAFRASPVWVLAALADLSGAGRRLIPEIAAALKAEGLLDRDAEFTTMDQVLDGLERTSSRLASTINTPPLDVAGLRQEWQALREEARALTPSGLPSPDSVTRVWAELKTESASQSRSVFEMSSLIALSATKHTGAIIGSALLTYYTQALEEIRRVGYLAYGRRQMTPYLKAAAGHFAPGRRTLTERLLDWRR